MTISVLKTNALTPLCQYAAKFLNAYLRHDVFLSFTKNLISENQSGFNSGDSILALITTITAAFIDISKIFDKLSHEGIIQELKPNGIQITW